MLDLKRYIGTLGGYGFGLMDLTARQSNRKKTEKIMDKLEQMNVCMRMSVKKCVCVCGLYTEKKSEQIRRDTKKKCMTADKFVVVCGLARSLLKFKIGPGEFYLFE